MHYLKNNIINRDGKVLCFLTGAICEEITKDVSFDIDDSITPYVKSHEKDYALNEIFSFSDTFDYIIDVELIDYGYKDAENVFIRDFSANHTGGELSLYIHDIEHSNARVILKGSVYTDVMASSYSECVACFKVFGINERQLKLLKIYQELVLEGYRLEREGNIKMAFFVYFSAIESIVSDFLSKYQKKIPSELHYALEHLALDEKIKVLIKNKTKSQDLNSVEVWSMLMQEFKPVKDKRNDIAHAKKSVIIDDDISSVKFCLVVLLSILNYGLYRFSDINKRALK